MRCMMRNSKVTMTPSASSVNTLGIPLGRSNSNEVKLEMARQSSLAMFDVGKPLLAAAPMAINVTHQVTFGPTTAAPNSTAMNTTAAPAAVTNSDSIFDDSSCHDNGGGTHLNACNVLCLGI